MKSFSIIGYILKWPKFLLKSIIQSLKKPSIALIKLNKEIEILSVKQEIKQKNKYQIFFTILFS